MKNNIDTDKAMEILHNASISFNYACNGTIKITEPSYVIAQKDLSKLFNYVKSVA